MFINSLALNDWKLRFLHLNLSGEETEAIYKSPPVAVDAPHHHSLAIFYLMGRVNLGAAKTLTVGKNLRSD